MRIGFPEKPQPFAPDPELEHRKPSNIAAEMGHTGDKALRDRIGHLCKHNGNRLSFSAQCAQRCGCRCDQNILFKGGDLLGECRVSIKLKTGPSLLNAYRFAWRPNDATKSLLKGSVVYFSPPRFRYCRKLVRQ
jgi:hypothetical protein